MTSFLAAHWSVLRFIPIYLYAIAVSLFAIGAKQIGWLSIAKGAWIGGVVSLVISGYIT